jgi:hypothetical protein
VYEQDAISAAGDQPFSLPQKTTALKNIFPYRHAENEYIDFKREPLIPYKCSRKGPYYAKADVNADGRTDFFIGGASGQPGVLLLQNADGSFSEKPQAAFASDKKMEDGGAVFLDADGDGDSDLYVVSGGAEFPAGSSLYQDRIYINDGKGNFTRAPGLLPKETNNGSYVISLDFDEDGDTDLFVGGSVTPGTFPRHDKNMLLRNNNGVFTDATETLAPQLNNTGIVNHAAYGDIDGDKKKELILAGEWMPVMIFKHANGKFEPVNPVVSINGKTTNMNRLTGWWNTVALEDVDNDGDLDILAGNRGLNSRIKGTPEKPCTIYAKDFDGNGSYDAVLGYYIGDKCYPMYHRDQLIDQMPFMRKRYYRYHLYAGQTLDDLFTAEQKQGMDTYTAGFFESGLFINEGHGQFRFEAFPEMAQFSPINDLLVEDWNNDGKKDIWVAGNSSDADVSTGNYDAMAVLLLINNGRNKFNALLEPGINPKGEVRKIIRLNKKYFVLLKNNAPAQVMTY